jgi:hypothetical protein
MDTEGQIGAESNHVFYVVLKAIPKEVSQLEDIHSAK